MIQSMTAFARAQASGDWGTLTWEIKTVNHRYSELSLRLPDEFRAQEFALRSRIAKRVKRGKVEATLRIKRQAGSGGAQINKDRMNEVVRAAESVAAALANPGPIDPVRILQADGVLTEPELDNAALLTAGSQALEEALDALIDTRHTEGGRLGRILADKAGQIDALAAAVRQRLPDIRVEWEAKICERAAKYAENAESKLDEGRLEQEFLILANKTDAEEELDRLAIHTAEVRDILKRPEPIGRRLDFLMQELNREANTLASKSQDVTVTKLAVDLKVCVEQMREQVQNIE